MSLILDALHKSELERDAEENGPGIQPLHTLPGAGNERRGRVQLIIVVVLAVLITLAITRFNVFAPTSPAQPGMQPPAEPVVEPPAEPIAVSPSVASLPAESKVQPVVAAGQLTQAAGAGAEPAITSLYARSASATAPRAAPGQVPAAQPDLMVDASAGSTAAAPPRPGLDVEAVAAAASLALAAPLSVEHSAPLIVDLPQSIRDTIPSIYFRAHSWSDRARESTVSLNGALRHEGDAITADLRLVEILPDSIVLDYRNTEFRLRALNSWINL